MKMEGRGFVRELKLERGIFLLFIRAAVKPQKVK